jgi:multidrug resistance efflux pump
MNMNILLVSLAACSLALTTASCGRPSATQAQANVAAAQASGDKDIAAAQTSADNTATDTRKQMAAAESNASHDTADADWKVMNAESMAANKVALERCESLLGDTRSACKKEADAQLALAKARADAAKAAVYART